LSRSPDPHRRAGGGCSSCWIRLISRRPPPATLFALLQNRSEGHVPTSNFGMMEFDQSMPDRPHPDGGGRHADQPGFPCPAAKFSKNTRLSGAATPDLHPESCRPWKRCLAASWVKTSVRQLTSRRSIPIVSAELMFELQPFRVTGALCPDTSGPWFSQEGPGSAAFDSSFRIKSGWPIPTGPPVCWQGHRRAARKSCWRVLFRTTRGGLATNAAASKSLLVRWFES